MSKAYFFEVAYPFLESELKEFADKLAFGMIGPGSDCFGYDDEISRDHDWGPGFCVFIPDCLFETLGPIISQWYDRLPKAYGGFSERVVTEPNRVGAINCELFYKMYSGLASPSPTNIQWLQANSEGLAVCTNGEVFLDNWGNFSVWRNALAHYPEDVRIKKIASKCFLAGQSGQYNYIRCRKRKDIFAADYAVVQFCSNALNLAYLLADCHAPYYKWLSKGVKTLAPKYAKIADDVETVITSRDQDQEEWIETLSAYIISLLELQGLATPKSDFLSDYKDDIEKNISDQMIRELPGLY